MTRPDDSFLPPEQLSLVRQHADRLLREADAIGRNPTPIPDLLAAAKVVVVDDQELDAGLLQRLLRKARAGALALKSALSKVLGLFEPQERLVVIEKKLERARRPFILLHETGHGYMPHQSKMYSLMQDCERQLDPDITDLFEREANVFASEVMFQGERFAAEAHSDPVGVKVPMRLAKQYGASQYSTFRRYVTTSPRSCALIVLEPPTADDNGRPVAPLRRLIVSRTFHGAIDLSQQIPAMISRPHPLAAVLPVGRRRVTPPFEWQIADRNGVRHDVIIESFFTTRHILVLLQDCGPHTSTRSPGRPR